MIHVCPNSTGIRLAMTLFGKLQACVLMGFFAENKDNLVK
jgi:hypothetical protein